MPFSITFDHIRSILYKQGRGPVAGPDSNPMKRRIFRVQVYGVGISPLQRNCCCFGFLLFFDILQIAMQSGAPLLTDCGAGIKDSDPKKQPSQANKQDMLRCEARQLLCWISKLFLACFSLTTFANGCCPVPAAAACRTAQTWQTQAAALGLDASSASNFDAHFFEEWL